jgi:hypothetical protein
MIVICGASPPGGTSFPLINQVTGACSLSTRASRDKF